MKVKTKLKTNVMNNSVNCIKYEGTCLRGERPDSAGDNNLQLIDKRFPLSQQTSWILTWTNIH